MATIAPRRKRVTRPGAARKARVSGSAFAAAAAAGGTAGSVNVPSSASAVRSKSAPPVVSCRRGAVRSEEHTSELQSLMRISYAVFCLKKKKLKLFIYLHNTDTTLL